MNETLKTIKSRRSIRSFKAKQIGYPELQEIIESGLYAPSAMNQQKWHFTVIQDKDMINKMVVTIKENIMNSGNQPFIQRASNPSYNTFYSAPTVIMISAEEKAGFTQFDCGAAAENIALAAKAQGIGSCIIASSAFLFAGKNANELKKELGIPAGYAHVCCVALGFIEGENPEAPPRNKEVVNYIRQ